MGNGKKEEQIIIILAFSLYSTSLKLEDYFPICFFIAQRLPVFNITRE
jgi:hypothetical protein